MLLFNIGFIFSVFPVNCNLQDEYTFQLICNPLDMFGYTGDKSKDTVPLKEVVIQLLSHVQLFATPWTAAYQASLCFTISQSLLKLTSIESVMLSDHFILCHPLLLLPSVFPSIRIFSNESAVRIRWPKYWSFSFSISSSNEYSGLISFRMGWFYLLAVQGTLKRLLQHHNSKASVLQHSDFFIFSHIGTWLLEKPFSSVQFSSVAQSCPTLCDPMNHSRPGLPVHHQLLEFTQTHVHRVGDVIQPSHPLSSPSPPAPNPSQHRSLFQWVNSSHEVAKVLEFQLQHQSFQWTPRTDLL